MKTVTNGQIPKDIIFIYRNAIDVVRKWEDTVTEESKENVKEAFITDATNQKTIASGLKWATQSSYNYATQKTVAGVAHQLQKPNDPISGVRVFTLEIRGQGGRAYKCITPDGFYVDMREDVLLDTIIKCGIKKNGVLNGKFVFARHGSQMKLVRVGSALHDALTDATERRDMPVIPDKELKPGGLYQNKRGDRAIFLGYGDYEQFSNIPIYKNEQRRYSWEPNAVSHYEVKRQVVTKRMLWWECRSHSIANDKPETIKKAWDETFVVNAQNSWSLLYGFDWKTRGSFKAIKEMHTYSLDEMTILGVREKTRKLFDEIMLGHIARDDEKKYAKLDPNEMKFRYSSYLNAIPTGEPIDIYRIF